MMLTVPASNVSVPVTVVRRTRSRVPDKETAPELNDPLTPDVSIKLPLDTHVFPVMFVMVTIPLYIYDATFALITTNPAVLVVPAELDADACTARVELVYPVFVTEPDPI